MNTKVLVFESDAAFAGELRNELGKLGCSTLVVDDGNVGLQQAASERPDLILLSIELPRMNGFSVCNKLKKDPALKDVPLIIMSSESSEETFEQHRKLRTRAEDYVHKPIAFGELLRHIQVFVQLGAGEVSPSQAPDGGIMIMDDEVAIASQDYQDDDGGMTQIARRPEFARPKPSSDADEVDAFTDAAFGRLTGESVAPPPLPPSMHEQNGAAEGMGLRHATEPPPVSQRASAPNLRASQAPPRPSGVDHGEHDRVKSELDRSKARAADLEREVSAAKDEISRLQHDVQRGSRSDADSQKMQREIDELKAKLAAGAKGGGISSREFLDLREALNKKDKEILGLKEQFGKKDKEIVEAQEKSLVLERTKADLDDRILAADREIADARDKIDALTADKDLAKKASEDFKSRLERAKQDLETRATELESLRGRHAEELAAQEAAKAALKSDHTQAIAREREEKTQALEQAEAVRRSDLEQAGREKEEALNEARESAARAQAEALAAREAELRAESDAKMGSLHRSQQQEMERARADAAQQVEAATREGAERLAAREAELEQKRVNEVAALERDRDERISALQAEHAEKLAALAREHADNVSALENDRDSRIAAIEGRAAREVQDARAVAEAQKASDAERIAKLEAELSGVKAELSALEDAKRAADAASAAKIAELEESLERVTAARDDHERNLGQARDRINVFEAELASTKQDLGGTRSKLAQESERAEKAYAKWTADRTSLERAKDALAVALSQIEDAESRPIAG